MVNVWTIPDYDLRHYSVCNEDRESVLKYKNQALHECTVSEGLKWPGFCYSADGYPDFYRSDLKELFAPPRGNLKPEIAVCGIAPGESKFSFGESAWLLGPTSKTLHYALEKFNIYPYFTNMSKKPFPKNVEIWKTGELAKARSIIIKEMEIVKPKIIMFLGKYDVYGSIQGPLFGLGIKQITVSHPSNVRYFGKYDEWYKDIEVQLRDARK
jgi:hypothetical protein